MRRLFWLAMGITIGVLVVRKLSAAAERLTPGSIGRQIADSMGDLADAIGDFGANVRAAAAEREAELRAGPTVGAAGAGGEAELRAGTGLDVPLPTSGQAALPLRRGGHAADH